MMLQTSNLTKFYTINCTDIAPIFVVYIVTMQTPPTQSPDSFLLQVDSGRLVQVKLMDALHQPAVRTLSLADTTETLLIYNVLILSLVLQQVFAQRAQQRHSLLLLKERVQIERLAKIEWRGGLQRGTNHTTPPLLAPTHVKLYLSVLRY